MKKTKKPKYRPYAGVKLGFGDFLQDYGKLMLNTVATPVETIAGRNFYDPEFKGQAFEEINNVTQGVQAGLTDVAGTMALGPAYGMAKQGIQMGVNVADPNKSLDKTTLNNNSRTTHQIGQGIASVGQLSSMFMPGTNQPMGLKMAEGGKLTEYPESAGTHESNSMGGIPVTGHRASVEGGETMSDEYVFSDRLVIDKDLAKEFDLNSYRNLTFASASKKINKRFPRKYDTLDQVGRERMLKRLQTSQEAYKAFTGIESFQKALGGQLSNYEWGGPYTKDKFKDYQLPDLNNPGAYNQNPYPEKELEINQNPIYDYGRLLPIAYNIAAGTANVRTLNKNNYTVGTKIQPAKYDIAPLMEGNRQGYANYLNTLKSASGSDAGTYLSNLGAANTQRFRQDFGAINTKNNTEAQYKMQADMANLETDRYNSGISFQVDDWNERSRANALNQVTDGVSQLGSYFDAKNQEEFTKGYLDMLSDNYKPVYTRRLKYRRTNG